MYQKQLAHDGEWLFKIRGNYLNLVVILSGVIAYFYSSVGPFESATYNQIWFWASFGVGASGALFRIKTSGHAALGTSGVTKKQAVASELNTTGPYSIVRNPLYVGRILNFTGIAMLSGSWVFGALTFLISVLVYERISVYEEEFLRKEFGDAHAEWAKTVPFLWPRFSGWTKPKYPFWIRRCIKREDKKVTLLFSSVVLCDFAVRGFDINNLPENLAWYYIWGAVTATYIVIRLIRLFTKTFDGIS